MPRPQKPPEDLNLIPLMNLFVTMIPLLLVSVSFYQVGMVAASVPTQGGDSDADPPTEKTKVTANVKMTKTGFDLTVSSATLSDAELKALDVRIARKGKTYDYQALSSHLKMIKGKYEQSDTLMLIPSKDTVYADMVKTMDAARMMDARINGKKVKRKLFPLVVVTELVQ